MTPTTEELAALLEYRAERMDSCRDADWHRLAARRLRAGEALSEAVGCALGMGALQSGWQVTLDVMRTQAEYNKQ